VEFSDQERVDEVAKLVKQRGFAMQDLVFLVAQSEIFRSK